MLSRNVEKLEFRTDRKQSGRNPLPRKRKMTTYYNRNATPLQFCCVCMPADQMFVFPSPPLPPITAIPETGFSTPLRFFLYGRVRSKSSKPPLPAVPNQAHHPAFDPSPARPRQQLGGFNALPILGVGLTLEAGGRYRGAPTA